MDGFDGDMRDMLGFASHVEVCGIAGICGIAGLRGYAGICGIAGYAGRTTSSKSPRSGFRFWDHPPQIQEGQKMGTENNQRSKKECLF